MTYTYIVKAILWEITCHVGNIGHHVVIMRLHVWNMRFTSENTTLPRKPSNSCQSYRQHHSTLSNYTEHEENLWIAPNASAYRVFLWERHSLIEWAVAQSDFLRFTSEKIDVTSEKKNLTSEKTPFTSETLKLFSIWRVLYKVIFFPSSIVY